MINRQGNFISHAIFLFCKVIQKRNQKKTARIVVYNLLANIVNLGYDINEKSGKEICLLFLKQKMNRNC